MNLVIDEAVKSAYNVLIKIVYARNIEKQIVSFIFWRKESKWHLRWMMRQKTHGFAA